MRGQREVAAMTEQQYTRCPGCKTIFRVMPEQLAMRGGNVRCGHCKKVFDGVAALISLAPERRASREEDAYDAAAWLIMPVFICYVYWCLASNPYAACIPEGLRRSLPARTVATRRQLISPLFRTSVRASLRSSASQEHNTSTIHLTPPADV